MLARDQGVTLMLWTGKKNVAPIRQELATAFISADVNLDAGSQSQGFQLSFQLRRSGIIDHEVFERDELAPLTRVQIGVQIGARVELLFDGVIGHFQITPGAATGVATLSITGRDLSQVMDLQERKRPFPNRRDSSIVSEILGAYSGYSLEPRVMQTAAPQSRSARVPNQSGTDLQYLRQLAERNGFVFYIEPTDIGKSAAYFGPERDIVEELPPLSLHFGPASNVRSLNFAFDPLARTKVEGKGINQPERRVSELPASEDPRQPLSAEGAQPLRTTLRRDIGKRSTAESRRLADASVRNQPDQVTAEGEVEITSYGRVLRPRRRIVVRGAGYTYDGYYRIRRVSHHFGRGQYVQRFSLSREGLGAHPDLYR